LSGEHPADAFYEAFCIYYAVSAFIGEDRGTDFKFLMSMFGEVDAICNPSFYQAMQSIYFFV
jgi:hypothetical protein